MTRRTWPAEPLVAATGLTLRGAARRLGIDPALLTRPLTTNQADKYATKLGYHPITIWGDDWLNP